MKAKGKILFDLTHGEEELHVLMEKLEEEGYECEINDKYKLEEVNLKNYNVLIFCSPVKEFYEKEVQNVRKFLERKGGCLLIDDKREGSCNALDLFPGGFTYHEGCNKIYIPSFLYFKSPLEWRSNIEDSLAERKFEVHDLMIKGIRIFPHFVTKNVRRINEVRERYEHNFNSIFGLRKKIMPLFERKIELLYDIRSFKRDLEIYVKRMLTEYCSLNPENLKKNMPPEEVCEEALEYLNKQLTKEYGLLGIASYLGKGRVIGLASNLFLDRLLSQDVSLDSNLRFALNSVKWLSEPSLKSKKISKRKAATSQIYL